MSEILTQLNLAKSPQLMDLFEKAYAKEDEEAMANILHIMIVFNDTTTYTSWWKTHWERADQDLKISTTE